MRRVRLRRGPFFTVLTLDIVSGAFSDHMCLLRAFQAWQKARSDGWEKAFCDRNYLSPATMQMIIGEVCVRFILSPLLHSDFAGNFLCNSDISYFYSIAVLRKVLFTYFTYLTGYDFRLHPLLG